MSIPYGKLKKTPQQNAACFLGSWDAFINNAKKQDVNPKALKKYQKYMGRMVEITSGKWKKCPSTLDNLVKIATEFGNYSDIVARIFVNFDVFTTEDKKNIIEIIDELLKIDIDPNPLSESLAKDSKTIIEQMLAKFDAPGMSIHYSNLLKIMTNQNELIGSFLKVEIFKTLSGYVWNTVFDISSEALSLLEEILFSENKDVQKQCHTFLNEHPSEMMEIFMHLFEQENYLAKREAMKIIHQILVCKNDNKDFYSYFVSQKDHLRFTMNSLNDESIAITIEAFELLIIFLHAPAELRGHKVNETLQKNCDKLMEFIEHFQEDKSDDEGLITQKQVAIKALKQIKKKKNNKKPKH